MKKRWVAVLGAMLFASALFADGPVRRTIVVKDGKVVSSDGDVFHLNGDLLGGRRAYLGVSLIDISPELREHYGASKENGVLIESVADGSPAQKAGLRVGDLVISIEGKDVSSSGDLRRAMVDRKEGDSVRIDLVRNRARQTLVAVLAERESGPRYLLGRDLEAMEKKIGTELNSAAWKARVERLGDCDDLQTRIRDLEVRLKGLEKKLK